MSRYTPSGAEWQAQRLRVLNRDGWVCQACGVVLEGADATVDHVDPISLDPEHDYSDDELTSLCRSCNSRKGSRLSVRLEYASPRWLPGGLPR